MDKPTYYAIIPADVRYCDKLKPMEKLMYGEITCLSNKHGYCIAMNNYFSQLYNKDKATVSRWISNLQKEGFVSVKIIREGKRIIQRQISLLTNKSIPIDKKVSTPIDEKIKDNTTSNNTTSNNKDSCILDNWNKNLNGRIPKIQKLTPARIKKYKKRISEGMDYDKAIEQIKGSSFLKGEKNDWVVSFDWLIANDENWVKLSEGKYKDKQTKKKINPLVKDFKFTNEC